MKNIWGAKTSDLRGVKLPSKIALTLQLFYWVHFGPRTGLRKIKRPLGCGRLSPRISLSSRNRGIRSYLVQRDPIWPSYGFKEALTSLNEKHRWVNEIPAVLYSQLEDHYVLEKFFINYLFACHKSQKVVSENDKKAGLRVLKHPYRMIAKHINQTTPEEIQGRWDARRLSRATSRPQATARPVRL